MNTSNLRCRTCNSQLKLDVGGTVGVCPRCGNRYSIKTNGADYFVSSFIGKSSTYKDPLSYTQPNDNIVHNNTQPVNRTSRAKVSTLSKLMIGVFAAFSICIITLALVSNVKTSDIKVNIKPDVQTQSVSKTDTSAENNTEGKEIKVSHPQTEIISSAVKLIFGKDAQEITAKEFESIKYLSVNTSIVKNNVTVKYSFEDFFDYPDLASFEEQILTINIPFENISSKAYVDDLHLFKGVTFLEVRTLNLKKDIFSDFKDLRAISVTYSDNPAEILPFINPKQISYLQLEGPDNLDGLEKFTSLETLYINETKITDISAILNCKNLKNLNISAYEPITNYYILEQMPQLESLTIYDDESIKDISFLSALVNLKSLTLKETLIKDISAIEKLKNLKSLNLTSNYMLLNIDPIASLTQLEDLTIDFQYVQDFSSVEFDKLSALTNLKSLNINYAYDAEFIQYLTKLENLTLDYCYCYNISEYIKNLKELKVLKLRHMISESHDAFQCLTELKNLKEIDLSYNNFNRDISGIFQITHLEKIKLYSTSFWITPEQIPVYPNLKVLDMTYWSLSDFMYTGGDGLVKKEYFYPVLETPIIEAFAKSTSIEELYLDTVELTSLDFLENLTELKTLSLQRIENLENIDNNLFANVNKLQNLYLNKNSISSLEFTKPLVNLENLDISNNYITDLTPLMELEKLQNVWAYENPVKYWDVLKDINVIH